MRTILKLIEPGNLRWSPRGNWLARGSKRGPWLDLYRQTDPQQPPDYLVREADDVDTEVVDRPVVDDGPIRIRVRDRRAEWRQRTGERT